MEEEFVTVDNRTWKEKAKDAWETGKRKTKEVMDKAWENRETVVPVLLGVLTIGAGVMKNATKYKELEEAETRRERAFYDRSLGVYWETRRPLTTQELLEVEERKAGGENIGAILEDMRLLKKKRR